MTCTGTRVLAILSFLAATAPVAAQEALRPDEPGSTADTLARRNSAMVSFDQNLSTATWMGRLLLDTTALQTSIRLLQHYTSNIIAVESGPGVRRTLASNQENLYLSLRRPVHKNFGLRMEWSSLMYSDDKAVGLSNASSHGVLGGLDLMPLPFLTVSPLAGYRWENQGDFRDRGFSYTLAGELRELDLDGYRFAGSGQWHEDRLSPRSLGNHFGRLGIQKYFSGRTRDSIEIGFYRLKREFYTPLESSIESRIDNMISFANLLEYEIDRNLLASLIVVVHGRGLDKDVRGSATGQNGTPRFDSRIDEFRLDTYLQAQYLSWDGRSRAQLRLGYSERDEEHRAKMPGDLPPAFLPVYVERDRQEQTKDNLSRRTSLSGLLGFPLSSSDALQLSGGASILRYDTRSTLNVEDRDELLIALSIATTHRFGRTLEAGLSLDGIVGKLVYLLKERSANNNTNRVLRFAPRGVLRLPGFLVSANTFEVLANYTVYDFEEQLAMAQSFSYRQFAWIDSTVFSLTNRVGLHFYSYVKLSERGQLNWNEFRERPENAFTDQTYAAQLQFAPVPTVAFAVGFRYFSQSRFSYEQTAKQLAAFHRSVGPICALTWESGRGGRVEFRGWYEHRRQPDGTDRALANMTVLVFLAF